MRRFITLAMLGVLCSGCLFQHTITPLTTNFDKTPTGVAASKNDTKNGKIDSPEAEKVLADNTLVLYIRADDDMEQKLIDRAQSDPKPLYYNEQFLRAKVAQYLAAEKMSDSSQMDPKAFAKWIFPELVRHRRPLYQSLADRYGYTVSAKEAEQVDTPAEEKED